MRGVKLKCALRIREVALELLKRRGEMRAIEGVPGRVMGYDNGSLSLGYRTPFQKLHVVSSEMSYKIALLEQTTGRKMSRNLEYGLDIWSEHKKVFNLEWASNDGEIHIVRFKRGIWEEALRSAV